MRRQLQSFGWFGTVVDAAFTRREDPTATLVPGQGAALNVGRDPVAVYRAPTGTLHADSAVCTHRQSIVGFDPDGPGWLCPRHGARFGVDGSILDDVGLVDAPLATRYLRRK